MDKENGDDGDSTIVVETNARRYEYSAENIFTAMIIVVLVAGVIIFLAMFTYFRSKRMVQTVPASTATFELADGQYQKTAAFA
jgi:hypothetical protein